MKFYLYPLAVVIVGLAAAQVLFSLLIYLSDISLYQTLVAVKAAGFLIVPNEQVLPSLLGWRPAFCGGIFFSLTIGAGLTLASLLVVGAWRRFHQRSIFLWVLFAAVVGFLSFRFDHHFPMTLACSLTIFAAGLAAWFFFPDTEESGRKSPFLSLFAAHLAVIGVVLLVWIPRFHEDTFVSIRDNLLLSNPIGKRINAFYYKYTLYPAEAFKSLDQKLLRSCFISIADKPRYHRLATILTGQDYLPVREPKATDLIVSQENSRLVFERNGQTIHQCGMEDFLAAPDSILEKISEKTDRAQFLRQMTFLSLIGVSPLICYFFVHAWIMAALFFIRSFGSRFAAAAILCVIVFTGPALLVDAPLDKSVSDADLKRYLASAHWRDRLSALKLITDQERPLNRYPGIAAMAESPVTAERYWAAKAMGGNPNADSVELLRNLLTDAEPNVVCMALYSLGKQNNSRMVPEILERMKTSDHWYVQWYAYKALKRLGWTQKR